MRNKKRCEDKNKRNVFDVFFLKLNVESLDIELPLTSISPGIFSMQVQVHTCKGHIKGRYDTVCIF